MRYRADENLIDIGVSELVTLARRGISPTPPIDESEPDAFICDRIPGYSPTERVSLTLPFSDGEGSYLLSGCALKIDGNTVYTAASVSNPFELKSKEVKAQLRGEAFIYAYMLAARDGLTDVRAVTVCFCSETRQVTESEESIELARLEEFFKKCICHVGDGGRAERERVTRRIPSMKGLRFPYERVRGAQSEFIRTAYRTIARGGELFATAPTGTGKTVSALFPAIRALGDGRVSKVFYLTPKTTTAKAAKECLELFTRGGAKIRAVILTAKEKLCTHGHVCRENKKLCPALAHNNMSEAVMALFDKDITVVDKAELLETANQYTVCPYELSLTYSELCDVIICDFNYLFDPQVYIRRFFSLGGDYAFLIDEAHNLGERAREMYSAEISVRELADLDLLGEYSELKRVAKDTSEAVSFILRELLKSELRTKDDGEEYGAYHSKEIPTELYDIFDLLVDTAEDELLNSYRARDEEASARTHYIREYLFRAKKLRSAMMRFDERFEFFVTLSDGELKMKVFCLDTGGVIKQRLALGKASVIFSGTLSPLSYYKSVLGGDGSSVSLELDSPFVSEQLCVSVMHNVTTRTSEREKSLPAVCRVIAATLSAKRGNYMIFAPSYAYAEALYSLFSKKYPKIRSILQTPNMSADQKTAFLDEFSSEKKGYLAAFCVTGGMYSEGIDLSGDKLIGAVIVGIGMPALSFEREAISAYYEERLEMGVQYAYLFPGMNKVLQAAGRVIRTENDRGVIVLIDDRFDDPIYKKTMPALWKGMQFLEDASELRERLDEFWQGVAEESEN